MEITLKERLELLLNWPSKGTPVRLMILDEIRTLINISKEEREEYEVKEVISEAGALSITWNQKGLTAVKEIELSKDQIDTLKDTLDKMEENFPSSLLELYKKLK
jgi:hypothetical protein